MCFGDKELLFQSLATSSISSWFSVSDRRSYKCARIQYSHSFEIEVTTASSSLSNLVNFDFPYIVEP